MTPEGSRGEKRSVAAMKAPKTQATVVKKPKTFWMRLNELYMLGVGGPGSWRARSGRVRVRLCDLEGAGGVQSDS